MPKLRARACRVLRDYFTAFGCGDLISVAGWRPGESPNPAQLVMTDQKSRLWVDAMRLLVSVLRDRSLHIQKVILPAICADARPFHTSLTSCWSTVLRTR